MDTQRASHPIQRTLLILFVLSAVSSVACAKGEAPTKAAYTVSWEMVQEDPACEEECAAKMAVILEAPGTKPQRLEVKPEGLSFSREMDSYGACSGAERDKGVLCASVSFSCGDSCYQDKLYLALSSAKDASALELRHFAGCLGGQECDEKPAVLFTHPLGAGATVSVKTNKADPATDAQEVAKGFTEAALRERFDADHPFQIVIDRTKLSPKSWPDAKKAMAEAFGRDSFPEWDDIYDEDYEGYHVDAWTDAWACDKSGCCKPKDPDWQPMCSGSMAPTPLTQLCLKKQANGSLALSKISFASPCSDSQ
jgi:hypothetical protein